MRNLIKLLTPVLVEGVSEFSENNKSRIMSAFYDELVYVAQFPEPSSIKYFVLYSNSAQKKEFKTSLESQILLTGITFIHWQYCMQ